MHHHLKEKTSCASVHPCIQILGPADSRMATARISTAFARRNSFTRLQYRGSILSQFTLVAPARTPSAAIVTLPTAHMAKTIHILGVGNIGLLFAHRLAESHGADMVNLLFHRHSLIQEWDEADRKIELVSNGIPNAQKGYGFQFLGPQNDHDVSPINSLIIATKATNAIAALKAVRPRLTSQTTVLFCQNGIGIMDELEVLFQDVAPEYIPKFMVAIVSHGVFSTKPFRAVHAGNGTVIMGSTGTAPQAPTPSTVSLSDLLCRTPALAAVHVPALQLVQAQLEKLVANAIINPLTVLFNCRNGQLFGNSQQVDIDSHNSQDIIRGLAFKLMHLLLEEICAVLQALPEAQRILKKEEIFSMPRMKEVVIGVADRTGRNISSMLQDIRAKRTTEIDYINGYVVKKGAELGINCGVNERVVKAVKAGRIVDMEEILKLFPELPGASADLN